MDFTSRFTRRCASAVGLAAVGVAVVVQLGTSTASVPVASAGPRPTATVSGAADIHKSYAWFDNLALPWRTMDGALKKLAAGLNGGGFENITEACSGLSVASNQYSATLPSPNAKVNFKIESVVDHLDTAVTECRRLGEGTRWEDAMPMLAHTDAVNDDLRVIKQVLRPYGG